MALSRTSWPEKGIVRCEILREFGFFDGYVHRPSGPKVVNFDRVALRASSRFRMCSRHSRSRHGRAEQPRRIAGAGKQ